MAVIRITRSHRLSPDVLRVEIARLASEIQQKLAARCDWNGNTVHFSRTGANGSIRFDNEQIAVEIKLGLALSALKSRVEKTVNDRLDQLLG